MPNNSFSSSTSSLPHHKLIAYEVALELLRAVRAAGIADRGLCDQAMRAAKSACLNCAEAAGRVSRPDKARVLAIARGEACEAAAAVEIVAQAGDTHAEAVAVVADRLVRLLTGFIRPRG